MFKIAKDIQFDPNDIPDPDEDIEGHIAGIHEADTPDQAIERYQQGNRYNELRSEAFIEKMAQLHRDAKEPTLS